MSGMKSFFSMLFSLRTLVIVLVLLALAGGGVYAFNYWESVNGGGASFRTEPVVRRNLLATIPATGTIEPEEVVDVGAQVAGRIDNFGVDPTDPSGKRIIDYCTPVEKDTVLARIDDSLYASRVAQAESALKNAQANVELLNAKKWQADQDLKRADRLAQGAQALAAADYDAAVATDKSAIASYGVGQAAVAQAQANLNEAKINLGYCTITSPVKGVIIDRRVNVGQTVVSSLNAPSLFLIAKDLMRLQVWASVNEADIGNIHLGEKVTFTVDARPGRTFEGSVAQIRYNATMTQNVVTYTVVVSTTNRMVENPVPIIVKTPSGGTAETTQELELLPYLTANLTFHVAQRNDAFQVPNAALRWRPQLAQVAPEFRDEYEQSLRKRATHESGDDPTAGPPPKPVPGRKPNGGAASHGMVWVPDGAFVRPIRVQTGLTDGANTEVVQVLNGDALDVGTALVTGENAAHANAGVTNPFQMKIFAKPKKKEE
jgi:HlyD family secretion protein